jgi:hypothetical protein
MALPPQTDDLPKARGAPPTCPFSARDAAGAAAAEAALARNTFAKSID